MALVLKGISYFLLSGRPFARARDVLSLVELLLPKRIREEDLGDALEMIAELETQGGPQWKLWLKCTSTIVWLAVNTLRELSSVVWGKKAE